MAASPSPADLTVDHAAVLRIAVPMTFAFLSTPLVGATDLAVVGQLGDAALVAGIGVGAVIFDLVFSLFASLRTGTTGLTAQALGAGDRRAMTLTLLRALVIALISGLAFVLLAAPMLDLSLALFQPSQAVGEAVATYFGIRILAAPLVHTNYATLGWCLGLGRSGSGLMLQILLNATNIVLSILLGLHLGWGVAGVAWGSVIAEAVTALAGLAVCMRSGTRTGDLRLAELLEPSAVRRMLAVNGDIMIRTFALTLAFVAFTRAGAGFGDVTLAANAILMNFFLIGGYFLDGLAAAAEQLTGRALGARRIEPFRRAIRLTVVWGFALSGLTALGLLLAGPSIIALMTTAEDVRTVAAIFLPWAAMTPVAGVLAFQMDGVFMGCTFTADLRNMMLLSLAVFLLLHWLLPLHFGNHGLWAALIAFLALRGVLLFARLGPLVTRSFPAQP